MNARNLGSILILQSIFLVSACDNKPSAFNEKPEVKTENPFSGQTKALDKAKELERQLLEKAEQQRKTIEEMTK